MKKLVLPTALVAAATGVAIVFALASSGTTSAGGVGDPLVAAAKGQIEAATLHVGSATRTLPFISDGTLAAVQDALGITGADERLEGADATGNVQVDGGAGGSTTTGVGAEHTLGCSSRTSNGNTRVNQDCTYRRQAEEDIVYNPADPTNLLAGQNDSRVGFNQCGIDFSTNNGKNWGDMLPPFRQKLNDPASQEPVPGDPNRHTIEGGPGTFHTYDAGSDPTLAFDSAGRGYFGCVVFDVASLASGLYVTMSPLGAEGSFFYNWTSRPFTVVEDNSPLVLHDKEFITADTFSGSPNRDNVYVTWTVFRFSDSGSYQQSPIFGSMSTDHGIHWSTPQEISGSSNTLCFFGNAFTGNAADEHKCDFDQGSDPAVLPNGDLEVVFNNGNTPAGNPNGQQLAVHCSPSGDSAAGTANLNCAAPTKVGNDVIAGEPQCDFGRGPEECIPGAYIRTNDYPRIVTNTQNGHLYSVWQDYRNGEFDIQMSQSLDGGLTWHEVGTVNPDRGLDHYFAAVDQSPQQGDRVGVSYYRTERVPGENTTPAPDSFAPGMPGVAEGNSDYVLAGGTSGATPYDFKVISPVFPPPDGIQAGFNGDYSGLVINRGGDAHPIWSDTRNVDPYAPSNGVVHDEDVFTDVVGLPNGNGKPSTGTIGRR